MRKILNSAIAAITFGGAVLATAAPAEAQRYRHDYYRHHNGGNTAAVAAVAGIAGLAIGSALSSNNNGHARGYVSSGYGSRNGYSYDPRYDSYDGGYYERYDYAPPRVCISRERVWDPYIERRVTVERRYPC